MDAPTFSFIAFVVCGTVMLSLYFLEESTREAVRRVIAAVFFGIALGVVWIFLGDTVYQRFKNGLTRRRV